MLQKFWRNLLDKSLQSSFDMDKIFILNSQSIHVHSMLYYKCEQRLCIVIYAANHTEK
jgi:hypothetical protein